MRLYWSDGVAVSRSLAIGTEDVLELSSTRPEASVTKFFLRVALRFRLLGSAAGIHLKVFGARFDHRRRAPTLVTVRRKSSYGTDRYAPTHVTPGAHRFGHVRVLPGQQWPPKLPTFPVEAPHGDLGGRTSSMVEVGTSGRQMDASTAQASGSAARRWG